MPTPTSPTACGAPPPRFPLRRFCGGKGSKRPGPCPAPATATATTSHGGAPSGAAPRSRGEKEAALKTRVAAQYHQLDKSYGAALRSWDDSLARANKAGDREEFRRLLTRRPKEPKAELEKLY